VRGGGGGGVTSLCKGIGRGNRSCLLKDWGLPPGEGVGLIGRPRIAEGMPPPSGAPSVSHDEHRHLHVRLSDSRGSIYDLVTEYLQAAGKAPDWFWRTAGRLEGSDADNLEELLSGAFEAGAFIAHDHPEDLKFVWVTEEECEQEHRAEERSGSREEARKERSSLSHYA
jgi:hypothetical protein